MRVPGALETACLRASYFLRIPAVLDWFRPGRTIVLMYHGISAGRQFSGVQNYYGYTIPVDLFARQLRYLVRNCRVLRLADWAAGRGLSKRRTNVVLTFDDGYENNFLQAFPLLKEYNLPATFALATGFVVQREPLWNDVLENAVQHAPRKTITLSWDGEARDFQLESFPGRLALYNWLLRIGVRIDQLQRPAFVSSVLESLELDAGAEGLFENPDYRPLQESQVREMGRTGLAEFASHSVRHFLLARTPQDVMRKELVVSKSEVEAFSGRDCRYFCVPGGSYHADMIEAARLAGYERVLTSDPGTADPSGYLVRRNGVFNGRSIHGFADDVHGPVGQVFEKNNRR